MNEEKKYTYINPTQINNYGSSENSAQTISRVIKKQLNDPSNLIFNVAKKVNKFWSIVIKSIFYYLLLAIIPFIICITLLGLTLHMLFNPNPSISLYFIELGKISATILTTHIPLYIKTIAPALIIIGYTALFIIITSFLLGRLAYGTDKIKGTELFKALAKTQIALLLFNLKNK